MEFQIEEMTDVCSIAIAAPAAEDVEEVGGRVQPEQVAVTQKSASNSWDEDYESRVTVEELLTISSRDSANVQAFKSCINELVSRQNCSPRKYSVVRRTRSGDSQHFSSLPSLADFTADVLLCGKRSLPLKQYHILCAAVEDDFSQWDEVPAGIRKNIAEHTGKLLLERKIFSLKRGTKPYWFEGRMERPQS